MSLCFVLQKLVQVLSDAYVILDWDDATMQAKLVGAAAAAQHRPLTPAATLRAITDPPAVRRAALKLLATALQWGEFMCVSLRPVRPVTLRSVVPACCSRERRWSRISRHTWELQ